MTRRRLRAIAIQGADVEIDAPDDSLRRLDQLLAAFPDAVGGPSRAVIRIEVSAPAPGAAGHDLLIDGESVVRGVPWTRIEDTIFFRLNRWVVSHDPEHVHLHCGVVSRHGRALLIVGPSGSGKSTLTAHLVRRGWQYHTDETAGVLPTGELLSYPRPLSLKPGSFGLFAQVPSVADAMAAGSERLRVHVPPGELGAGAPSVDPVGPGLVVVLAAGEEVDRHGPFSPPAMDPLRPEECVGHLVANSMDLPRMGAAGVRALVDVARRAPAVRMSRVDLDATDAALGVAFRRPHQALTVEELPPVSGREPHRSPGVHTWVMGGDGAVVFREDPGEVFALDRHALMIWRRLDGRQALTDISRAVGDTTSAALGTVHADLRSFVDELVQQRLLTTPPA